MHALPVLLAFVWTMALAEAPARAQAVDPAGIDFFEKRIRPVLVEHCYKCHSAEVKKPKGGLLLDTRAGIRKGGDTAPAVVPGKPAASLILKAVRQTSEELRMPPKGKLPDAVIADLEKWIAVGAPDPREGKAVVAAKTIDFTTARRHWAYQPIRKPDLPQVKNQHWPASSMDCFVLAKLEEKGLTPSPQADRRTLLRRAYYDLIGLPPTYEEIEAFEKDRSPDAFANVVDRLLASPRYGERWGRHWLDVARYADTKDGVLMYGDDRIRPYAYTYRDYVIRAFNEDTPFDRLVHEQLAADLIEPKVESWRLAAMGFLTLGRMFDNNVYDIIDDRIDTVTRGLLGLTVSCARCHDHKYDAIPTADYYSMYGVFAGCETPLELPLIGTSAQTPGLVEFEKKFNPKREEMKRFLDKQFVLLSETARQRAGDYLVHAATTPPDPLETAIYFLSLAPEDLRPQIVNRWRKLLDKRARPDDPVFGPWHDLMQLPPPDLAVKSSAILEQWKTRPAGIAKGQLNLLVREALLAAKIDNKAELAKAYGRLLRRVYDEFKQQASQQITLEARRQLLELVSGPDSPGYFPKAHTWHYMSRGDKDNFSRMKTELDRLAVQSKDAPPRAMVLNDAEEVHDPVVFVRGNPGQPGERVPRRFLRILAGDQAPAYRHGSGRLELAKSITAADNPLTSRVIVNRAWMHHFGEPLVATPNDFGTRSSPPSHPELLDYLAFTFRARGWSLKDLHRTIMLSRAYQQASFDRPDCRKIDPENRLLWRAHRRRLDLEAMRDSLLYVSGRLDATMHGRPVDVANDPLNRRRTVYGLVDRQSLPGLFRTFDFANPDQSAERRPYTTVPQQALFGMNSPFVIEQAKSLAARPELGGPIPAPESIKRLYRIVLARDPEPAELQAGLRFLLDAEINPPGPETSQLTAWQRYVQVVLLTNETLFVD
jgi:hypothetical protein